MVRSRGGTIKYGLKGTAPEFISPAGKPLLNHLFSLLEDRVASVIATPRANAIENLMHSGFAKCSQREKGIHRVGSVVLGMGGDFQ